MIQIFLMDELVNFEPAMCSSSRILGGLIPILIYTAEHLS